MAVLPRIEALLERLFEAPAGLFGARLQPVMLSKRIERAMDTNKSFGDDGVIVPNHYDLHLNPADFAAFESYRGSLEDDLGHGVLARARRERYHLVARPRVRIVADRSVRRGDVRVAANVVDEGGDRLRPAPRRDAAERPASTDTIAFRPPASAAPAPSALRAYLLVSTAGQPAVQFEIDGPLISIGRASDNDIVLDDPLVSRHHCQLRMQHGAYAFADLGSSNGSAVNGQPVTEIALGPGDVIGIGQTAIEFQVREA